MERPEADNEAAGLFTMYINKPVYVADRIFPSSISQLRRTSLCQMESISQTEIQHEVTTQAMQAGKAAVESESISPLTTANILR